MLAERYVGQPIWLDALGNYCKAGCAFCFPGANSKDDMLYSFLSTGFDGYQPDFDLSQDMQEKWDIAEEELRYKEGDNGREPPSDGDQRDGEDGGAGAKLTLFVDVAGIDIVRLNYL